MWESMFIRLFAGVSSDHMDVIPFIPFGQWLLSVSIFLFVVGFYMERNRKVKILSLYRYGTIPGWWKRHFGKGMVYGLKTAAGILLIVLICDIVMGNTYALSIERIAKISVLWILHSISMAALFTLFDLFPARSFVPGMLLLLEGVTFIIGCRIRGVSSVMYGMWGMYLRSSLYKSDGFPAGVIAAAEVFLLAASFYIGQEYLKKDTKLFL